MAVAVFSVICVIFYGGNNANGAYTEYFRNNRSTETVDFNKVVKCSEDFVMTISKEIILDNTSGKKRLIRAREDGAQSVIEISNERSTKNQIRLLNAGSTPMIVDSTNVYTPRQIQGDTGLKVNFIDTRTTGADFIFRRDNIDYMTFSSDKVDLTQDIVMQPNKILYLDEGTTNKRYIRSSSRTSPSVQNHLDIVQENTSIGRIRLTIGAEENLIVENSQLYSLKVITAVAGVKSNTINSNGNNDLVFQRNSIEVMKLNSSNSLELSNSLVIPRSRFLYFHDCHIREQFSRRPNYW